MSRLRLSGSGILEAVALVLLLFMGTLFVSAYVPIPFVAISNMAQFRVQLGAGAAIFGFVAWLAGWKKYSLGGFLLAIAYLSGPLSYSWPAPGVDSGKPLRVVYANVQTSNRDTESFRRLCMDYSPDLIVVLEPDDDWKNGLAWARDSWPHHVEVMRDDNFGIAVYSRIGGTVFGVLEGPVYEIPAIRAMFDWEGESVSLLASHVLPPADREYFSFQKNHLKWLGGQIRDSRSIFAGDLNTTEASCHFQTFLAATGLRDSRQGFGWQPSWPASIKLPLGNMLLIPIDHIFVPKNWIVYERKIGPNIGSDHFPIMMTLAPPAL